MNLRLIGNSAHRDTSHADSSAPCPFSVTSLWLCCVGCSARECTSGALSSKSLVALCLSGPCIRTSRTGLSCFKCSNGYIRTATWPRLGTAKCSYGFASTTNQRGLDTYGGTSPKYRLSEALFVEALLSLHSLTVDESLLIGGDSDLNRG